ncbi:MAG: hypothetical protein Q7T41_03230 [Candidatus Saccharibacteria bacterium]|nr:hypothetical protein [Candidatus Saccharibacteria bacterium]
MQHLGVISFIPFWVFVIYILNRWPKSKDKTISKHGAANKTTYLLYAFEISYNAITFLLLNLLWSFDYHQVGTVFKIVIYCVVILQLIFAWVPDIKGIASIIHNATAYLWGLLLYLSLVILLLSASPSLKSKVFLASGLAVMSVTSLVIIINKAVHKNLLTYQLIYIGMIHVTIIVTSYTG